MSIGIENKEIHRQNLVKDAFKQLLNRLNARKTSPLRHNPSKIIKRKSEEHQKCRRYSAGFKYKAKQLLTQQTNRNSTLFLGSNNALNNLNRTSFSKWSKKDVSPSRCKTQSRNKTLHSIYEKPQNTSPLLIAKSFVFQYCRLRETEYIAWAKFKKPKKEQQNEFSCTEDNFRRRKNYRKQQQRMLNFRKVMKKKQGGSIQFVKRDSNLQYQPWQTEHQADSF